MTEYFFLPLHNKTLKKDKYILFRTIRSKHILNQLTISIDLSLWY